jgi:hypothetical protein
LPAKAATKKTQWTRPVDPAGAPAAASAASAAAGSATAPAAAAAAAVALPPGWKAHQNAQGKTYYHNTATGATSWTLPSATDAPAAATPAATPAAGAATPPASAALVRCRRRRRRALRAAPRPARRSPAHRPSAPAAVSVAAQPTGWKQYANAAGKAYYVSPAGKTQVRPAERRVAPRRAAAPHRARCCVTRSLTATSAPSSFFAVGAADGVDARRPSGAAAGAWRTPFLPTHLRRARPPRRFRVDGGTIFPLLPFSCMH